MRSCHCRLTLPNQPIIAHEHQYKSIFKAWQHLIPRYHQWYEETSEMRGFIQKSPEHSKKYVSEAMEDLAWGGIWPHWRQTSILRSNEGRPFGDWWNTLYSIWQPEGFLLSKKMSYLLHYLKHANHSYWAVPECPGREPLLGSFVWLVSQDGMHISRVVMQLE